MPAMRTHELEKYKEQNPHSGSLPREEPTVMVYIQVPATYRVLSYHLWLGLLVTEMQREGIKPDLLMNISSWWRPYSFAVRTVYDYFEKYGTTGYITDVIRNTTDEEIDLLTAAGNIIQTDCWGLFEELLQEALDFCAEISVPSMVTREDNELFNIWYNGKYESTSAVHRAALSYLAANKPGLAKMCVIFMVMPNEAVLAVKHEKKEKKCRTHDWKMTYINEEVQYFCRTCGLSGDEHDDALPLA